MPITHYYPQIDGVERIVYERKDGRQALIDRDPDTGRLWAHSTPRDDLTTRQLRDAMRYVRKAIAEQEYYHPGSPANVRRISLISRRPAPKRPKSPEPILRSFGSPW